MLRFSDGGGGSTSPNISAAFLMRSSSDRELRTPPPEGLDSSGFNNGGGDVKDIGIEGTGESAAGDPLATVRAFNLGSIKGIVKSVEDPLKVIPGVSG